MEMFLVKDAGFDLADVRGEREVRRHTVQPSPLEERVASIVEDPSSANRIGAATLIAGAALALAAGSVALLAGSAAAAVFAAKAVRELGLLETGPRDKVEVVERGGMTEREARQFAVLHDEQEKIKQEKAEEERNKHG